MELPAHNAVWHSYSPFSEQAAATTSEAPHHDSVAYLFSGFLANIDSSFLPPGIGPTVSGPGTTVASAPDSPWGPHLTSELEWQAPASPSPYATTTYPNFQSFCPKHEFPYTDRSALPLNGYPLRQVPVPSSNASSSTWDLSNPGSDVCSVPPPTSIGMYPDNASPIEYTDHAPSGPYLPANGSNGEVNPGQGEGRPPTPPSRIRNRRATRRSREKSKQQQAEMVAKEQQLHSEHDMLLRKRAALKQEVLELKTKVLMHGNCESRMIQEYIANSAGNLSQLRGQHSPGLSSTTAATTPQSISS